MGDNEPTTPLNLEIPSPVLQDDSDQYLQEPPKTDPTSSINSSNNLYKPNNLVLDSEPTSSSNEYAIIGLFIGFLTPVIVWSIFFLSTVRGLEYYFIDFISPNNITSIDSVTFGYICYTNCVLIYLLFALSIKIGKTKNIFLRNFAWGFLMGTITMLWILYMSSEGLCRNRLPC